MMKWFIRRVFPGVADVLANPLWRHSMFIKLDFPTFERPMKAYSGLVSLGHIFTLGAEITYSDFVISIFNIVYFLQS